MPDTALILEGGGMRGCFSAGVMDYLMEQGVWIPDVYGVSAGACLACSYICGQIGRGLRVWTEHVDNPDYCSLRSLVKTGDLFGADFNYRQIPYELDPLDFGAAARRPFRFVPVVTDVETGEAAYPAIRDMREAVPYVQASASLPLLSNLQVIDGRTYLDGGVADSIPLQRSIGDGHVKHVLVLTQTADYRKSPSSAMWAIRLRYRRYPAFVEAMRTRHERYNAALALIRAEEAAGRAFIIRPDRTPGIDRVERDPDKLRALHAAGYAVARREYPRLRAFLEM